MTDILGPASDMAVTTRPARTNVRGVSNTWFRDCTAPDLDDGTACPADWLNDILAQLRTTFTQSGITQDNADDMLWRAIQSVRDFHYITTSITKTVGGVGADFSDLNAAFTWLSNYTITQTGLVTFALNAGKWTYNSSIRVAHPNIDRVAIVGAGMLGSVASTDFTISGSGGGQRSTDTATNLAMLRTRFATEFAFTGGHGILMDAKTGFTASHLLVTGDGTHTSGNGVGILILGGVINLTNVIAVGHYSDCIQAREAAIENNGAIGGIGSASAAGLNLMNSVFVQVGPIFAYSNALNGINQPAGAMIPGTVSQPIVARGNASSGIYVAGGNFTTVAAASVTMNGLYGLSAYQAQVLMGAGSVFNSNGSAGISAYMSRIAAQYCSFASNSSWPVRALAGSVVDVVGSTGLTGVSPALNTLGNNNSLIIN